MAAKGPSEARTRQGGPAGRPTTEAATLPNKRAHRTPCTPGFPTSIQIACPGVIMQLAEMLHCRALSTLVTSLDTSSGCHNARTVLPCEFAAHYMQMVQRFIHTAPYTFFITTSVRSAVLYKERVQCTVTMLSSIVHFMQTIPSTQQPLLQSDATSAQTTARLHRVQY